LIALAACLASTSPLVAGSPSQELAEQVDQCVATSMAAWDIPGLAVAVVYQGELAHERGYGVKHRTEGGAVDQHTLFRHGSTGKMFTAAAIMRLVDQGLVDLDDPVTEYVPELHFATGSWTADQMKLRHLLTNSGAIPSFRIASEMTLSEWAETLDEVPLLARPGELFNYSNSNFALAGLVVERASGRQFTDFVATEVYQEAGMLDSTFYLDEAMANGNVSFGHADDGSVYAPDDYFYWIEAASGVSFSSAHDLALWAQQMLADGGHLLSRSSAKSMQAPQVQRYTPSFAGWSRDGGFYGLGLFVDSYPEATIVWHDGGVPGWVGHLSWTLEKRFAVALLANSWPSGFNGLTEIAKCIYRSVPGIEMPDMSEPSPTDTWSGFAGTYDAVFEDGGEFEVTVFIENETLRMTAPDPANPDRTITRSLESINGPVFRFWAHTGSYWDLTFLRQKASGSAYRWLRNQRFVGLGRLQPRQGARRAR
jgi:CubicO group peptidase (beta-lactamase class C family)